MFDYPKNSRNEIFRPGEIFIYQNGDSYEIGKVYYKNHENDGYFCYYHTGSTCANTPVESMHKIKNDYVLVPNQLKLGQGEIDNYENNKEFGKVVWTDDDIYRYVEDADLPKDTEFLDDLLTYCRNDISIEERMIEAGWEQIYANASEILAIRESKNKKKGCE